MVYGVNKDLKKGKESKRLRVEICESYTGTATEKLIKGKFIR